jgi:hypothetical protein
VIDGAVVYQQYYLDEIRHAVQTGNSRLSLYTQHLMPDAIEISTTSDFPPRFLSDISWMTSDQYFGPQPYVTADKDTELSYSIDSDFIGFTSETIELVSKSFDMVFCPDPSSSMHDCKMKYAGKALHRCINTTLGIIDGKYTLYVAFPNADGDHSKVIHTFFEKSIHRGIGQVK